MLDKTPYYFAYGSNLEIDGMAFRCPYSDPIDTAVLHGWQMVFRGVADIEEAPGQKAYGAVFKITEDCLEGLDRYEGFPMLYDRRIVPVELSDGKMIDAITYVMEPPMNGGLNPPSPFYYVKVEAGFEDWGLPKEILESGRLAALDDDFWSAPIKLDIAPKNVYAPRFYELDDGTKLCEECLPIAEACWNPDGVTELAVNPANEPVCEGFCGALDLEIRSLD